MCCPGTTPWSLLLQPGADLCQFNRAQVVFHALYNHLYSREAPLIQVGRLGLGSMCPGVLAAAQSKAGGGRACSLMLQPGCHQPVRHSSSGDSRKTAEQREASCPIPGQVTGLKHSGLSGEQQRPRVVTGLGFPVFWREHELRFPICPQTRRCCCACWTCCPSWSEASGTRATGEPRPPGTRCCSWC